MATTHNFDLSQEGASRASFGPLAAADRRAAFRLARRRSAIVRFLRVLLPAGSLALVAGYVLTALETAGWGTALPDLSLRQILPEDLAMNNPRYEGYGDDGSSYVFTAKTARQELAAPSLIKLDEIGGTVLQPDKTKITITAARGTFDHQQSVLELHDTIDVISEGGLKAKLTQATFATKEGLLTSNRPVVVEFPTGSVRSQAMTFRQKAHEITFAGEVEARLLPAASPGGDSPQGGQRSGAAQGLIAPSGAPIDVVAERLDVRDRDKNAVFSGKVKAVQSDSILSAPELQVVYDGAPLAGNGAATPAGEAGAKAPKGARVRRIIAKGPVVMTRATPDVVTSDGAEFDATNDTAILKGNVVMSSAEDRRATCDRADLDQGADTALLTGNVIVVQGRNHLTGRRLLMDRKNRRAELTAPSGPGTPPGRITARLYQGKPAAKSVADEKPPPRDAVSGRTLATATFKTDPNAPVDVEADKLNVDDAAGVAVFGGRVRAAQGNFIIESAELHAFYAGEGGLGDVSSHDGHANKQTKSAELTKIEARKDVVVTSKGGETVTGDWATLDAKANTVTVGGDVVLSQNQNVVRGTRLVIDMTSGRSTIDTAPAKAVALPAGGGWMTQTPQDGAPENRGRASAVFFPHKVKGGAGSGKPSADAPDAGAPEGAEPPPAPFASPGLSGN
jgi:LPS export ABC transporter protein LptC